MSALLKGTGQWERLPLLSTDTQLCLTRRRAALLPKPPFRPCPGFEQHPVIPSGRSQPRSVQPPFLLLPSSYRPDFAQCLPPNHHHRPLPRTPPVAARLTSRPRHVVTPPQKCSRSLVMVVTQPHAVVETHRIVHSKGCLLLCVNYTINLTSNNPLKQCLLWSLMRKLHKRNCEKFPI